MPTLPNMTLVTPTQGADSGTWDDKINACFALVDAHDHTSGKGVAIVSAALSINADVAWGGYGITGIGRVDFSTVAALAAGANVLFVSSADGELYWRTTGGTNVKLTDGSSINTTLVGGIVGDYSSVGAEVAFSDADQVYTFKDQSSPTKKWARMASGPVRIYENDTTESVYVEQAVAAALASSYTATWPAALPGAGAFMQISAAGLITFSNAMGTDITASDFKFSTARTTTHAPHGSICPTGTFSAGISGDAGIYTLSTGGGIAWIPLMGLCQGDRVISVHIVGVASSEPTFAIYSQTFGGSTLRAHTGSGTIAANDRTTLTLDSSLTLALSGASGTHMWLKVTTGASTFVVAQVTTSYDRP